MGSTPNLGPPVMSSDVKRCQAMSSDSVIDPSHRPTRGDAEVTRKPTRPTAYGLRSDTIPQDFARHAAARRYPDEPGPGVDWCLSATNHDKAGGMESDDGD